MAIDLGGVLRRLAKIPEHDFYSMIEALDLDPFTDLAGADLAGVNLAGVDLRKADLRNADLRGQIFAERYSRGLT